MRKYELTPIEPVISEENAIDQVLLFLNRYRINIYDFEEEQQQVMEKNNDMFVKLIMEGHFEIFEDDGLIKVKQFIKNQAKGSTVSELIYGEVDGKAKAQMGESGNEHVRINNLMVAVCESSGATAAVEQLRSADRRALEVISAYFL